MKVPNKPRTQIISQCINPSWNQILEAFCRLREWGWGGGKASCFAHRRAPDAGLSFDLRLSWTGRQDNGVRVWTLGHNSKRLQDSSFGELVCRLLGFAASVTLPTGSLWKAEVKLPENVALRPDVLITLLESWLQDAGPRQNRSRFSLFMFAALV